MMGTTKSLMIGPVPYGRIKWPIHEFLAVFFYSGFRFRRFQPSCERIGANQMRPDIPTLRVFSHALFQTIDGIIVIFSSNLGSSTRKCRRGKMCASQEPR